MIQQIFQARTSNHKCEAVTCAARGAEEGEICKHSRKEKTGSNSDRKLAFARQRGKTGNESSSRQRRVRSEGGSKSLVKETPQDLLRKTHPGLGICSA